MPRPVLVWFRHDLRLADNPALTAAESRPRLQQGRTGYPLVGAGTRHLGRHGWVHNRVRMVVASFLVKHLLQPWQDGATGFWDTLVDADLANNSAAWQWVAGFGSDAAPFLRGFNPVRIIGRAGARQRALDAFAALPKAVTLEDAAA